MGGVRELADGLDSQTCPGSTLQHLELGSCRIGTAGAGHLFTCLARNDTLRILRISDNFLDRALDIALIERLMYVTELGLNGNRLSHASMQRAAQTCSRNRQRARDEAPLALRAEMHRLLFQEAKLETAREAVSKDDLELTTRQNSTDQAAAELRQLRNTEAEVQRQVEVSIQEEEEALEASRAELIQTKEDLVDARSRYNQLRVELKQKLKDREQELLQLQVQSSSLDELFSSRKSQHPEDIEDLKARMAMAVGDAERYHVAAKQMREQVSALHAKSLVDFKP